MFPDLLETLELPTLRGRLQSNAPLGQYTWLRVGGPAQLFFSPADEEDLSQFLAALPIEIPVTVLGVGSNLIVRDGGIPGVVIRLSPAFGKIAIGENQIVQAGAAALDKRLAIAAAKEGVDGLSFLSGIPGAIGGALRMNAGAHGGETKDILLDAVALDRQGTRHVLMNSDFGYSYRHSTASQDLIFTSARFQGKSGDPDAILADIQHIEQTRLETQPIKSRTAGSTFKNPLPHSSWKVIDAAGGRGMKVGNAQMSEMHCNFLLNLGDATAHDLETLGERIRKCVYEDSGILLEWEVKRLGVFADGQDVEVFQPEGQAA